MQELQMGFFVQILFGVSDLELQHGLLGQAKRGRQSPREANYSVFTVAAVLALKEWIWRTDSIGPTRIAHDEYMHT